MTSLAEAMSGRARLKLAFIKTMCSPCTSRYFVGLARLVYWLTLRTVLFHKPIKTKHESGLDLTHQKLYSLT